MYKKREEIIQNYLKLEQIDELEDFILYDFGLGLHKKDRFINMVMENKNIKDNLKDIMRIEAEKLKIELNLNNAITKEIAINEYDKLLERFNNAAEYFKKEDVFNTDKNVFLDDYYNILKGLYLFTSIIGVYANNGNGL